MSRYYEITISKNGQIIRPASLAALKLNSTFASHVNGQSIPGALDIEMNLSAATYEAFDSTSTLTVWGIGLKEIAQATNLAGCDIIIRAGMKKGLPLANPQQAGVVVSGVVFQPYGNWQGNQMTLNMNLSAGTGEGITPPKNFAFNWKKGQALSDALQATLQAALPDYAFRIAVSPQLIAIYDFHGVYSGLTNFASMLNQLTNTKLFAGIKTLTGTAYSGVSILPPQQKTIVVTDGTTDATGTVTKPKQIAFTDLIGQPTWYSAASLNFKTVLRGDIAAGQIIQLPTGLATPFALTAGGNGSSSQGAPSQNNVSFKGQFVITKLVHYARFRQPDANSWCTSVFADIQQAAKPPAPQPAAAPPPQPGLVPVTLSSTMEQIRALNPVTSPIVAGVTGPAVPNSLTTESPASQLGGGVIPP